MGYNEQELMRMTPRFFVCAMRGFERNNREAWERSRMIGYLSVVGHLDQKKPKSGIADVWPLPWDKSIVDNRPKRSEEEKAELWARIDQRRNEKELLKSQTNGVDS